MSPTDQRISLPDRRSPLRPPLTHRRGFSLIEVILATAILLGSAVVLSELAGLGRRQSMKGLQLAEAQQLCEQTLNEVLIGLRPLEPQEQEPLLPVTPTGVTADAAERFAERSDVLDPFPIDVDTLDAPAGLPTDETEPAEWLHSLRVLPLEEHPGLAVLTVVIEQSPEASTRPIRFELSRWIDDPFVAATDDDNASSPLPELSETGGLAP